MYDIKIIREYKVGEDLAIPFLFSLDKIRAFKKEPPIIYDECINKYKVEWLEESFSERLFLHVYKEYFITEYDEEFLKGYKEDVDYVKIDDDSFYILNTRLFYEVFMNITNGDTKILQSIRNFIDESEVMLINKFYDKIISDLEYNKKESVDKNNIIHMFQWALGHESINPHPFFQENLNKPTSEWSLREVLLRNLYRSKEFDLSFAIQKLKHDQEQQYLEDMKNKKKGR